MLLANTQVAAHALPPPLPCQTRTGFQTPAHAQLRSANVPASVTIAQAILESGWGGSAVAKNANNYFGIKGSAQRGSYSSYRKYCTVQQGMKYQVLSRQLLLPGRDGQVSELRGLSVEGRRSRIL